MRSFLHGCYVFKIPKQLPWGPYGILDGKSAKFSVRNLGRSYLAIERSARKYGGKDPKTQ